MYDYDPKLPLNSLSEDLFFKILTWGTCPRPPNISMLHMLIDLLYLWIMISIQMKSLSWVKLLSISLPSPFRGHPDLAKYHTVWTTFSKYFLLDVFSLACAIRIVSTYIRRNGCFLENHLNSLIVESTGLMFTESTSFLGTIILPV